MHINIRKNIKTISKSIFNVLLKNETHVEISLLVLEIFDVKKRPKESTTSKKLQEKQSQKVKSNLLWLEISQ